MQAGVNSIAAVKLASRLQASTGIVLSPIVVFQHPTPRAIAAHLSEKGAPASLASAETIVALLEELIPPAEDVLPTAPRKLDASEGGADEPLASPLLVLLSHRESGAASGGATALFAIPNGTGRAEAYKALGASLTSPIYGLMHPYLCTPGSRDDLSATTIEEIADSWAAAIVAQCTSTGTSSFVLIGASLGGLFAHLVSTSAAERGHAPTALVLIDPAPLNRSPLANSRDDPEYYDEFRRGRSGLRGAAAYLMMHTIGSDLDFLNETDEADLGVRLAARQAEVGLTPFSEGAVLEQQRELRATAHLLGLAARYQSESHALPSTVGGLLSRVASRFRSRSSSDGGEQATRVWLALSAQREDFFMTNAGLTREEASADTARLFGNIVEEIALPGTHIEVCQRCMIGDVDAFTAMLRDALGNADAEVGAG
uniref:Carrier domain-containing protein n=1 Tax=Prymnesium polylepis TaxID=72548 RepID=A0A6T8CXT1_9EUKA